MAIGKVNGIDWTNVAKVNGISAGDIANVAGIDAPAGAGIITSGLYQFYDASNSSSYPGSGTTWTDLQGTYNVTLYNGVSYVSSSPAHFDFDGVNDYALGASNYALSGSAMTVEAWFRKDTSGNYRQSICASLPDTLSNRRVLMNCEQYTGKGRMLFINTAGAGMGNLLTTTNLSNSTWYHMVGTVDGSAGKLYLNGTLQHSLTLSGTLGTSNLFGIGYRQISGSPDRFNGDIAKVRIYNRALDATEVATNWNFEKTAFGY